MSHLFKRLKHQLSAAVISIIAAGAANAAFAALPSCGPGYPDSYELGTGVNWSGFCSNLADAEIITQLFDLNAESTALAETQKFSLLKQADQLAQEILAVQNLTIQTETLLRDLEENPLQVIVPDANQIIANQNRINKLAQDIKDNSSSIGSNLIKDLQHPDTIGLGYGSKFQLWSDARTRAAQESYDKVLGLVADLKDQNTSVSQAIKNIDHAQGRTATAKAAANAAGQQLAILARIEEVLGQMLGMQAVENGAKLQTEQDTIKDLTKSSAKVPGQDLLIPRDTYQGPAPGSNSAF